MKTIQELNSAMLAAENNQWDVANKLLNGFGIEYVSCAGRELKYVNLGDTYEQTICAEMINPDGYGIKQNAGKPFIDSWGSWYEQAETEHCESEGLIRCGHCSEFTVQNTENWQETTCSHCNNLVGG